MNLLLAVLSWVPLGLLPFNLAWTFSTRNMRRCVPGSIAEAHYKAKCRMFRYPAICLWPLLAFQIAGDVIAPDTPHWGRPFLALIVLWDIQLFRWDLREFRRQVAEDDDDPWNRGKKLLKRARRAVRNATTIRVPQVAPARF